MHYLALSDAGGDDGYYAHCYCCDAYSLFRPYACSLEFSPLRFVVRFRESFAPALQGYSPRFCQHPAHRAILASAFDGLYFGAMILNDSIYLLW